MSMRSLVVGTSGKFISEIFPPEIRLWKFIQKNKLTFIFLSNEHEAEMERVMNKVDR